MSRAGGFKTHMVALGVTLGLLAVPPVWADAGVSPAAERRLVVRDGCPTFSWAPAKEAATEIRVWRLDADATATPKEALQKSLPAGASSWTASREECLSPGRYAWTVRSGGEAWAPRWLFDVSAAMPASPEADGAELGVPAALADFTPPPCVAGQEVFVDVPAGHPFCAWIQQLYSDGVTGGCSLAPLSYCPQAAVTRGQMAVFIERAMRGTPTWDPTSHAHFGQLWQGSASIGLEVSNTTGSGLVGRSASSSPGVLGSSDDKGVYGSGTNAGVYGTSNFAGVQGDGAAYGVYGTSVNVGVRGLSGPGSGVHGEALGGTGIRGTAQSGTAGVFSNTNAGTAVYLADSSRAAWFTGGVHVAGTLTKVAGSFRIDHPLDPANKYLSHSFVESPDMLNVYNGNVALDASGQAVIELPDWFEALNRDFRYQLSAVGVSQPGLFVAAKVKGNRFRIGGGVPRAEVSWQVTGIRDDAYARAHRIPVEEQKAHAERGFYLFPEGFGAPKERALSNAGRPGPEVPVAE
jgi:hypothetical protein